MTVSSSHSLSVVRQVFYNETNELLLVRLGYASKSLFLLQLFLCVLATLVVDVKDSSS